MERIIGVNSNCYHGYTIEQALEGIWKAGFRYVELTATKGWTEHVFPTQSLSYLNGLRTKMEEMGITPFALSGHCNLMDEERLPDFMENMALAEFFGCRYIVSSIGEAHLKDRTVGDTDLICHNLGILLPALEHRKLELVLEIHGQHCTGEILKNITDRMGSDWIKINYDTANAIFYGGVDPAEDIDTCMDSLAYMHLKDKAGEQKEWNFPAPGKGTIDFPTIFQKLEKAGNNCPFSIEIEFTQKGSKNLDEIDRAVQDSAKYLEKMGFRL